MKPGKRSPARAAHGAPGKSPRGEVRREAVLEAAKALFLERGFAGTNMNEVVQRAGGSLATVYACFGSKEGLFEVIIQRVCGEIAGGIFEDASERLPPAEALQGLGERYLARVLRPDALGWMRMCVNEGPHHPALRLALFRAGPGRVVERLAAYLEAEARAGSLRIESPAAAARQFLALLRGSEHMEALCGEPKRRSEKDIRAHVRSAVDLFLHGCSRSHADERRTVRARVADRRL